MANQALRGEAELRGWIGRLLDVIRCRNDDAQDDETLFSAAGGKWQDCLQNYCR